MATSDTQMFSSPKNWKREWRHSQSNNSFVTKRFINVHAAGVRSLTPNSYQERKRQKNNHGGLHKTAPGDFSSENRPKIYKDKKPQVTKDCHLSTDNVDSLVYTKTLDGSSADELEPGIYRRQSHKSGEHRQIPAESSSRKRPASTSPLINKTSSKTAKLHQESKKVVNRESVNGEDSRDTTNLTQKSSDYKSPVQKSIPHSAPHNVYRNSIRSLSQIFVPKLSYYNIRLPSNGRGGQKVLGEGMFGFVTRGKLYYRGRGQDIVAKIIKPSKSTRKDVFDEAKILYYLSSTRAVPKVYGIVDDRRLSKLPVIVQECFANGQDFYKVIDNKSASRKTWVTGFLKAASGLAKIHRNGIILNDIKPDNILMSVDGEIRFIDMGMATFNRGMCHSVCPTLAECDHFSPQTRRGEETTTLSDVYSFGMLMQDVAVEIDFEDLFHLGEPLVKDEPSQRATLQDVQEKLKDLLNGLSDI